MPRRLPIVLLAAAAGCAAEPGAPPNVLLVVLDSLAAGHASAWGGERATTPALDALAAGGVRVDRAYAPTAWTIPSVASLFTGLEQELHGLRHLGAQLPSAAPTAAERFRAAGYATHAVLQNPLLDGVGIERGFDRVEVLDWDRAPEAVERARAAAAGPGPWFLYVHLAPPHMPYAPPPPWRGSFVPAGAPVADGSVAFCRAVHRAGLAPDDPRVLLLAARYDEHVRWADELLRRLLADLPVATVVAVTSDHGEAFMQHGAQGHNATVYEEMVRVPLAFAGPGVPRGAVDPGPASLVDVAATLLELAGVDGALGRGRSLAAGWAREPPARPDVFVSARYRDDPEALAYGLVRGDAKVVVEGGAVALYDLGLDPGETLDLATERPAEAVDLARAATAFWRARAPADAPEAELPETWEHALRALGYLDEGTRR